MKDDRPREGNRADELNRTEPAFSWFPGHMLKASRELKQKAKLIDLVIHLLDSRAPLLTMNHNLLDFFPNKPILFLLGKADQAEGKGLRAWKGYFQEHAGRDAVESVSIHDRHAIDRVMKKLQKLKSEIQKRRRLIRPLRIAVTGVPNVGKSSLINRLIRRRRAQTGPQPGVTRHQQWLPLGDGMELLDTPGIMLPRIPNEEAAQVLSLLGIIRDRILGPEKVALFLVRYLQIHRHDRFVALFDRPPSAELCCSEAAEDLLDRLAMDRGFLKTGGDTDHLRCAEWLLQQFREGKLGKFCFTDVTDATVDNFFQSRQKGS
ncbi:MAG: ribosome biogenesis GTPase YlqF [Lentisphaerae bacterium]|nr:MAG: ribosome biogenesis GTPase YlqF [Lentisphaerota bacterium]